MHMLSITNKSKVQVLFFQIVTFAARLRNPMALNNII